MSALQTEFGGANPISLSEYVRGGSYVPSGTTSAYGTIPTTTSNMALGLYRGTQKATVLLGDHSIEAFVGSTFNGTASTMYILWGKAYSPDLPSSSGKVSYLASVSNSAAPGRRFIIDGTSTTITQSTAFQSGYISGEWLLSGNPGDYQVRFTQQVGWLTFSVATPGSFNTWLTLDNGSSTTSYIIQNNQTTNDAADVLTVEIRDVATQTIQDTASIIMETNAAGIN
jgi:hypothetical protein